MADFVIPQEIKQAFYGDMELKFEPLGDGEVNTTLLVSDEHGFLTVLQQLSPIFDARVGDDYEVVSNSLLEQGWNVPKPIAAADGNYYVADAQENLWRVFSYVPTKGSPKAEFNTAELQQIGALLAKLHHSLGEIDYQPKFSLPHFHETAYYMRRLQEVAHDLHPEALALTEEVLAAYKQLPPISADNHQLIHGDPRTSNMMFHDGTPFTFIDFDTVMLGSIWLDIGDLLRSMVENSVMAGKPVKTKELLPLIENYRLNYDDQLAEAAMTRKAIDAAKIIALELTARFLIDVVEDRYFAWDKTKYASRADYVFERARTQWQIYEILNEGE